MPTLPQTRLLRALGRMTQAMETVTAEAEGIDELRRRAAAVVKAYGECTGDALLHFANDNEAVELLFDTIEVLGDEVTDSDEANRDGLVDDEPLDMTQRYAALKAVEALKADPWNVAFVADLERVLAKAQNGPPDGMADGSIPAELWTYLRGLVTTLDTARMDFRAIELKAIELKGDHNE